MFPKLRLRTFSIGLLVFSSLWVTMTVFPLLYSVLFPQRDLQDILYALELRRTAPPQAATIVQRTIAAAGPLRGAVQVGYYSGITATFQLNASHRSKKTQVAYLAWFQKIPKPFILVINRYESGGVLQGYEIDEDHPMSFVRGYGLPLLALGGSLYLVLKKNRVSAVRTSF